MPIPSGLSAQIGLVEEVTYGTFVAPTRFLPFEKENIKLSIARDEFANSIGETTTVLRSDRWTAGVKDVGGSANFKVLNKGFGLFFKHMLGAVVISTPTGGLLTRDQTCTLGDLTGKSLTFQVGRPDVGGVVRPFSYLGCKIDTWELSNSLNNFLELALTLDGQNEDTAQVLAAASYPASATVHHWAGGSITVGGVAFPLRSIKIKGSNGLEGKRYNMGSQLKKEPLHEKLREITGEIEAEFADLTAYNRFVNGTTAAIVATWQGPLIESTLYYQVVVTLPVCRFDGDTPNVDGFHRLTQKLPFKVLNDGVQQPIQILYRSTDTAS